MERRLLGLGRTAAFPAARSGRSRPRGTDCALRFQGQYFDAETGLHYNTLRCYNPGCGRFISPDPINIEGGLNLYQYAPNAANWIDPWGWACHGNSKGSRKAQHGYEIIDTHTGSVAKTGVSGGKIRNGKSVRAEAQARRWNREPGNAGRYSTRVVKRVKAGPGARYKILAWEQRNANRLRGQLDPKRHNRP
jgi:RHS repeat-associated protein